MSSSSKAIAGSYKDPSGFVFTYKNSIYRQINKVYSQDYEMLMKSGLYKTLAEKGYLVSHKEVNIKDLPKKHLKKKYKIIKPEMIDFISYPYEWTFSQLRDAALLTLEIHLTALEHSMTLKDASAYNIVFDKGKPIFIDTLSFEKYESDKPWVGYRQFCQHFLAPLALASYIDLRFIPLLKNYLDGYPLDFASKLLPKRSYLNTGIAMHLHLHSKSQNRFAKKNINIDKNKKLKLSKTNLVNMLRSLTGTINSLKLKKQPTEWGDYYDKTNYSKKAFENKKEIVERYISKIKLNKKDFNILVDLGANQGQFSVLGQKYFNLVLSTDYDLMAVEKNYQHNKSANILPLVIDIINPSANIGFGLKERNGFFTRQPFNTFMGLALIHHLCITFNLQFSQIAEFLSKNAPNLIIEFVPKKDSQVKILLKNRRDIFTDFNQEMFEKEFSQYYQIQKKHLIKDSVRTLYLMKRKHDS